jgi:Tol biopolymer transport system component
MNTLLKHITVYCFAGMLLLLTAVSASSRAADERPWAIFVVRPDGSDIRKVVQVENCGEHASPRWSHDGRQIAFNASPGGWSANEIYVVNVDGSGLRKVGQHVRADWSPDDKQIVFDYYPRGSTPEVYVQGLDGQGRTLITAGKSPRWSPDGSLIAASDRNTNVFLIDLLSGETRNLFDQPVLEVFDGFCWSRDGSRLAVVVRRKKGERRHCLIVNAEGESKGVVNRVEGEMGGYVSFSPDGKQLVYSDGLMLRTIEVEGTRRFQLMPGQKGKSKHPDWSPDGQWIVFSSDREMK